MKLSFWDILASMVMLAGLAMATIFINIFVNPYSFINPFPPPTPVANLEVPTLTPSQRSLPGIWTATPEIQGTPTVTGEITSTETITVTGTHLVLPTGTKTPTPTKSLTPTKTITRTPNVVLTAAALLSATSTKTKTSEAATATLSPCATSGNNVYCDDKRSSITYTGTWKIYSGSGPYANTNHYSSDAGATARFRFSGSTISYMFPRYVQRGHANIYIDGLPVATISGYSSTLIWRQLWDSGDIGAATHTITIEVVDGIVDLDAFIINRTATVLTDTPIPPPSVTTNPATSVSSTGATLNGTVSYNGSATTVTFQYGLTTALGTTIGNNEGVISSNGASVTGTLAGLTPGTTYYYRVVGTNAAGTTNGTTRSFTTSLADQAALTANVSVSPVTYGTTATLSTTGGSGTGAVTYSRGASTGCTISGTTLSVTNASGTCDVVATKAGDATYNAVSSAPLTVPLAKATQAALNITDPGTIEYLDSATLATTGGTGTGAVTYDVGASTGCGVVGALLTVNDNTGSCDVTATKATGNNYLVATSGTLTVTMTTTDQVALVVTNPGTVTYGTTEILTTTGGSGTGAVSFDTGVSTGCSVAGDVLSVTNASGSCSVTATKAADTHYNARTSAPLAVTLAQANQTISFTGPGTGANGATVGLTATASSSLTVEFTSTTTAICTISGTDVTYIDIGNCIIRADQPGDDNYNAAPPVSETIVVS